MTTLTLIAHKETDDVWEQVLESALRKRLTTVDEIVAALPALGLARTPGVRRMRRVLEMRPDNAPATESMMETLMVQLIRSDPRLHHKGQPVYDANRQTAIVAATGWLPGRFTWTHVTRLQRTSLRRLCQLLERSGERRAVA